MFTIATTTLLFSKKFLKSNFNFKPIDLCIWFNVGVDFVGLGDTEQTYQSITLRVLHELHRFWDRDYKRSSPDFGNFASVQAGKEEVT